MNEEMNKTHMSRKKFILKLKGVFEREGCGEKMHVSLCLKKVVTV